MKFTNDNIKIIRPGYGLKTKYYKKVLNQGQCKFDQRNKVKIITYKIIMKQILKKLFPICRSITGNGF